MGGHGQRGDGGRDRAGQPDCVRRRAKIGGKHPAPAAIILFSLLMLVCAVGMWRLRYWAVLGFMGLLAIIVTLFALLLVEASNLLGFLIPPVVIAVWGLSLHQARPRPQPHPDAQVPRALVRPRSTLGLGTLL